VTLWEALAGSRPYGGDSLETLRESLVAGHRNPRPSGLKVSRRVFRAIERGLAVDPLARWPSLRPLLDRLEASCRPRRGGGWAAGLVLLGGGTVAIGIGLATEDEVRCAIEDVERIPGGEVQRASLERAFAESGLSEVRAQWSAVEGALRAYETEWAAGYESICVSVAAGEIDPPSFDLRMACLRQRGDAVGAVVEILRAGDPGTLVHAGAALGGLPAVDACLEAEHDDLATALPPDPEEAMIASRLRTKLASVEALTISGRLLEAEIEVKAAVEAATELGFEPVRVEAGLRHGVVVSRFGRPAQAEPILVRAYWQASDLGYSVAGAEAAIELAWQSVTSRGATRTGSSGRGISRPWRGVPDGIPSGTSRPYSVRSTSMGSNTSSPGPSSRSSSPRRSSVIAMTTIWRSRI